MIGDDVRAGFVYDVYVSDGTQHEHFPYWALLQEGDDVDVDHHHVHVVRVLRIEEQHYAVYATPTFSH